MIEYITTEQLLKKPVNITHSKLMSMLNSANRQTEYFRQRLLIAYEQQDMEVVKVLNKCIENEYNNTLVLNELIQQRLLCRND